MPEPPPHTPPAARPSPNRPRVLHLSITPRGGWHSHAVALTDLVAEHADGHHLLLRWPGSPAPRRADSTEIRRTWLGRRATGAFAALPQVADLAKRNRFDWVHLHGLPSEPVGYLLALALRIGLRRSGAALAVTPHNAFGRRGPLELRRMRTATLRRFDRVFVFRDGNGSWAGPHAVVAPFVLATGPGPDPDPDPDRGADAHRITTPAPPGRRVACLPGQIRADKGFHLVPAALAGQNFAIRIAGPDRGGYARLLSAARRHDVPVLGRPGFAEEDEFRAAIAESDVVVLPYARVTQSGVLTYADAAGTPVAGSEAMRRAGLAAAAYFDTGDVGSLRSAIELAAGSGRAGPAPPGTDEAASIGHLYAPPPGRTARRTDPEEVAARLLTERSAISGVFVVGSPRSGTTVVARWLADRLGAELPPETHYFTLVRPALAGGASRDDLQRRLRRSRAFADAPEQETRRFVDSWWSAGTPRDLDRFLAGHGSPWIEKTPAHLRRWPELLRFDGRAHIVVVTRSLPATLVSQAAVPWLSDRSPRSLLSRILADRLHLLVLQLVAPRRVHRLRYEDFVAEARDLTGSDAGTLGHEHWKALSSRSQLVDDRNASARARRPDLWRIGQSRAKRALAGPGAVARVAIDLARSLGSLATGGR